MVKFALDYEHASFIWCYLEQMKLAKFWAIFQFVHLISAKFHYVSQFAYIDSTNCNKLPLAIHTFFVPKVYKYVVSASKKS